MVQFRKYTYLEPLAQAKYRPSGLNAIARQNLLSSRAKFAHGVYGISVPAELHTSTPTLERTRNDNQHTPLSINYSIDKT